MASFDVEEACRRRVVVDDAALGKVAGDEAEEGVHLDMAYGEGTAERVAALILGVVLLDTWACEVEGVRPCGAGVVHSVLGVGLHGGGEVVVLAAEEVVPDMGLFVEKRRRRD